MTLASSNPSDPILTVGLLLPPPVEQAPRPAPASTPRGRACGTTALGLLLLFGRRTPAIANLTSGIRQNLSGTRAASCGDVALGRGLAAADQAPAEVASRAIRVVDPRSGRRPRPGAPRGVARCEQRERRLGRQREQRDQHHAAEHHAVVALGDALDEVAPEPAEAEDRAERRRRDDLDRRRPDAGDDHGERRAASRAGARPGAPVMPMPRRRLDEVAVDLGDPGVGVDQDRRDRRARPSRSASVDLEPELRVDERR